jgi:hypothetical protein
LLAGRGVKFKLLVLGVDIIQRWCWWLFWEGGERHDWAAG